MRNRLINCNFYTVQRKLKNTVLMVPINTVLRKQFWRRDHMNAQFQFEINLLNLPQFKTPWHRRALYPSWLFWIFSRGGAFNSLCLSKRPADPLPGILSEASNVHPKRSHSPVTQTYITAIWRRAGAAPGPGPACFFIS